MKNTDKKSLGFAAPAPPHIKSKSKSPRYTFTSIDESRDDELVVVFQILTVPGFVSPADFAADMAASGSPPRLHGHLTLFSPEFVLGEFSYRRPDGTTATARAGDVMEITPPQLSPPSNAPDLGKAKTAPPPPEPPGMDMSF